MALVAGAARVLLDPPLGIPMMGYAARSGPARARGDPLFARALYLAARGREALLVELDLCLLSAREAASARAEVARRTGVASDRILVGCTHTHSGPETGLPAFLAGADPPAHVAPLLLAAGEAAARARAMAAPARLGAGRTEAHIGRNRRRQDGPVDAGVLVVRVDLSDGAPLAVLYLHGCHPTVLGHENLAYSADWPGAASACIEAELPGALALFCLGAHADVDPRTRGLMDLAVEGQSAGAGFEAARALGRELGLAVAAAAAGLATHGDVEIGAASARIPIQVHGAGRDLADERRDALAALDLPPDSPAGTGDLFRLAAERTRGLAAEERRERLARVRRYLRDRTAARFAGGARPEVEAQILLLGPVLLLGLPLEPTVDVGLEWRRRTGSQLSALVGIANGWLRYLPHARNFDEPGAHCAYEVLMSTFVPEAADLLLARGEALATGLART